MSETTKSTKAGGEKTTKTEIEMPSISYLKYFPIGIGIGITAYAVYYIVSEYAPGIMQ